MILKDHSQKKRKKKFNENISDNMTCMIKLNSSSYPEKSNHSLQMQTIPALIYPPA